MPAELEKVASAEFEVEEPFDLDATASAYNFGWYYDGSTLLVPLGAGVQAFAAVREARGGVAVELFSRERVDEEWALERVSFSLGLGEDLSAFWALASRDAILGAAARALRGMRLRTVDLWTAFVVAACQQNASFRQGWAIVGNILSSLGKRVRVAGRETIVPPSPRDVLRGGARALREARAGYRAEAIIAGAELFEEVGAEELSQLASEELERALCSLRGVGPYTARVAALFGLRRYGVNPVDRWLAKIMAAAYGAEVASLREAERLWASRWGEWAGLAAFFATIVTDALPAPKAVARVRSGELLPREDPPHPTPMTLWRWTGAASP